MVNYNFIFYVSFFQGMFETTETTSSVHGVSSIS